MRFLYGHSVFWTVSQMIQLSKNAKSASRDSLPLQNFLNGETRIKVVRKMKP